MRFQKRQTLWAGIVGSVIGGFIVGNLVLLILPDAFFERYWIVVTAVSVAAGLRALRVRVEVDDEELRAFNLLRTSRSPLHEVEFTEGRLNDIGFDMGAGARCIAVKRAGRRPFPMQATLHLTTAQRLELLRELEAKVAAAAAGPRPQTHEKGGREHRG